MTTSVLALSEIRSGVVTSMRALGKTAGPPVEIEAGWMALAAPRQVVQTRTSAACLAALADVQQPGLVWRPETVHARGSRDQAATVGLVEVVPP
jgi:hypothetical protein